MPSTRSSKRKSKSTTSNRVQKGSINSQHLRTSRKKQAAPRTHQEYVSKSTRFQSLWDRIVGVITKMRAEKTSLQSASREIGVSPKSVKRWAGPALQKTARGKWTTKPSDRLLRVLVTPTSDGLRETAVRDSKQATLIGEYWNAVHRYLETGDHSRLDKFHGKFITDSNGVRLPLLTDRTALKRLGSAGELSFESIYGKSL